MNSDQMVLLMSNTSFEEQSMLKYILKEKSEAEKKEFLQLYMKLRRDPVFILIFSLIGLFGFAGIHRLVLGDIVMAVLYFLLGDFALLGLLLMCLIIKT